MTKKQSSTTRQLFIVKTSLFKGKKSQDAQLYYYARNIYVIKKSMAYNI